MKLQVAVSCSNLCLHLASYSCVHLQWNAFTLLAITSAYMQIMAKQRCNNNFIIVQVTNEIQQSFHCCRKYNFLHVLYYISQWSVGQDYKVMISHYLILEAQKYILF